MVFYKKLVPELNILKYHKSGISFVFINVTIFCPIYNDFMFKIFVIVIITKCSITKNTFYLFNTNMYTLRVCT